MTSFFSYLLSFVVSYLIAIPSSFLSFFYSPLSFAISSFISHAFLDNLQFVEFTNKSSHFLALIDSGSQLNIISHSLLPFITYKPCRSPFKTLKGISGRAKDIHQWIEVPISLATGQTQLIYCAVITDLPCVALFGLPFLKKVKAVHDVCNAILHTPAGPITLVSTPAPQVPTSHLATPSTDNSIDLNLSESNLTELQRTQVHNLLREYDDLWRGGKRGKAVAVAHRIRLLHDRPIVSRPRPISEEQKQILKTEVQKMLDGGVIRPSSSPYASEVVIVPKKTGDWRFCIDFRFLNWITIKDKYPLPRISDLIHAIRGSKFFVALDLRAGYWQVPMDPESIKYTAFRCCLGLFEFLLMPFGLTNAPATFQRLMDFLFGDLRFAGVLCYLDDILIHSPTFEHALELLRGVFDRLRAAGLTINLPKSDFFPKILKYLGHVSVDGRLVPDPKKVEAIDRIRAPRNLNEVRSLLGFLGYYHSFIPHYASIMLPIFDLLRNTKNTKRFNSTTPVTWTDEHQAAVKKAGDLLKASVLEIPFSTDEYLIETDASEKAIGAVLNVKRDEGWRPVEFYSKTLSTTQQNWPVREREAFAIVAALQKFDTFVRGRHIIVHTDHESLQWMLKCSKGKIARWASLLAEYDMEVYYKKGTSLVHVDFLSRFLDPEPDPILADRMCYFTSVHEIPSLSTILSAQQQSPAPTAKGFIVKNNVTYYHGLIWVPPSQRVIIMTACHSIAPFHHPGIKKTKRIIQKTFNWPNLHQDVVDHLHACLSCRRARSGEERLQGLFRTHPIPLAFDTVYMDFWECAYDNNHYKVLTLIDQSTKWAECAVIPDAKATTVASTLLRSWVYRFGCPSKLMSDQDRSFCNDLLNRLSAQLGVTRMVSTPYHPQGNAVIESFHRTLSTGLRHLTHPTIPFPEALDMILFAYRATIHSTTGHSPSYLTYGIDPRLPLDQDWRLERSSDNAERLKFLSTLRLDVQLQAQQALVRQNMNKNQNRTPMEFEEGQLVLCRAVTLDQLRYKAAFYKAVPRWTLPHRVIRVLPTKKSAIVRCLLTQKTREIHLQDAQFLSPPQGEAQREEWTRLVTHEAQSMFDPSVCQEVVANFFEALDYPQHPIPPTPPVKRRRVA